MRDYEVAREKAIKQIRLADHILTMTYPLVNDPKLLKLVMKNIYLSMESTIAMLLHYERFYKRIPPFTENFQVMLERLHPVLKKHNISTEYVIFLNRLNEIMNKQTESDIEFVRKDKFVFASRDYYLSIISTNELKDYLAKAKVFMQQLIGVVDENERNIGK